MGKKVLFAFMAIATMIAIATSCNNEKKVIALHDTAVADSTLKKDIPMEEFYKESLEGKKAFVERNRMQLTYNSYEKTYIKGPESITFLIGSGTATNLQGNDKKFYDANFEDELIVITSGLSTPDTTFVFNGVSCSIKFTKKTEVGHGSPWRFEIKDNQKLKDCLNLIEKWDSLHIESSYSMPGLKKEDKFSTFLKENEKLIHNGDLIDCFDRRILDQEKHDVVNFKKRAKK
jgi:hypothetical protein